MKQLSLSYWDKIVFVDWHGVISRDPFWVSILNSCSHPLRSELESKLKETFSDSSVTEAWMKGDISSKDIISKLAIRLDKRFNRDFLERRLVADCYLMRIDNELLFALKSLKERAIIVLATDNMDCFSVAFRAAREMTPSLKSSTPSEFAMQHWAHIFDDIVCSSDIGTLKAEGTADFFSPLLSDYNLRFSDALLIDDREDNCEAFRQLGGKTFQWKKNTPITTFIESVDNWL